MNKLRHLSGFAKYSLFIVSLVMLTWVFFLVRQSKPFPLYRIRFAVPGFQSSALVLLAHEQGFFAQEGIDATLDFKATGRDCLDLVLKDGADFAVVFETPIVHASLEGHKITILTELHRSDHNTAVVVRKDRGIKNATDLLGKTIAVVPKTNAEFLLDLYLRSHLINLSAVNVKKIPIAQAVEDLGSGKVDAAALWEPYVGQVISKNKALFTRFQSSYYSEFSVLAGLRDNTRMSEKASFAVLRSLRLANDFIRHQSLRAHEIVDKKLRTVGFFVSAETWESLDINIGLSATLLTMLNEEANWYRHRDGLSERIDMQQLLDDRYVRAIAPRQVTFE